LPSDGDHAPGELGTFERFCLGLPLEDGRALVVEHFQRTMLIDYFDGVVETLILIPKKNGKTTLLAALALYHVIVTPDAECVIGAASRDQATILYEQAVGFVTRSSYLQQRVVAKRGYREIRSRSDRGRIRVLAADVDTADGIIPTLALVDELHRHKSAGLYGVFRDGLGPRHGQMVTISTAGDHERSVLGQMRAAARKLPGVEHDGKHVHVRTADESFALHEWSLDRDDDVENLALVKQVNPASWQTIELLAQRLKSPSTLPWQWARFACGVWMSAEGWWVRPEDWDDLSRFELIEAGEHVTLGFDGSRYGDATALVACRLSDGRLELLGVWEAPRGVSDWEVPAGEVDAAVARAFERYAVVRAYFDPPLWQTEIDGWARDFGEDVVVRYPTNRTRFMAALERFRTDVASSAVTHTDDEALTRHVLAAQMREVRGGYWLEKATTSDRIDAAIASVLAYEARSDIVSSGWRPRSKVPVSF
jgi:phage terminase large subunit-like protein